VNQLPFAQLVIVSLTDIRFCFYMQTDGERYDPADLERSKQSGCRWKQNRLLMDRTTFDSGSCTFDIYASAS